MDDSGHRENGRHKPDHYKTVQAQWMMPQHQLKDHQIKIMSILTEKDNAIHDLNRALAEKNRALAEKKAALEERDMAVMQRDAAIAERNTAIMERNNALAALERAHSVSSTGTVCPVCPSSRGYLKGVHNQHHVTRNHSPLQSADSSYLQSDLPVCEAYPISSVPDNGINPRRKRQRKDSRPPGTSSKKASKTARKGGRGSAEDLNKQVTVANWRGTDMVGSCDDLNKEGLSASKQEWRGHDLGLNHVTFDETTMPVPGCSCTGTLRQCYKWGNGGWQSACCNTTMSAYPLPQIPNKRHARIGGRKMSGGAFTKLLSRLAREGYDLSMPLDLKHHWAKHGTNRYITIK